MMGEEVDDAQAVYVYEAPVRLWHWINAGALVVLMASGYFIASPPPSLSGAASDHFLMGDIKFAHFVAAYVFTIGLAARLYWALVGNRYARRLFVPFSRSRQWRRDLLAELRWYLFIDRSEPRTGPGLNPLAQLIVGLMFLGGGLFEIVTGFALYGEPEGAGSFAHRYFTSWVVPLFGDSQNVHTWHHLVMWYLLCFVIVHVYLAIREDVMTTHSSVGTMISGWRYKRRPAIKR